MTKQPSWRAHLHSLNFNAISAVSSGSVRLSRSAVDPLVNYKLFVVGNRDSTDVIVCSGKMSNISSSLQTPEKTSAAD